MAQFFLLKNNFFRPIALGETQNKPDFDSGFILLHAFSTIQKNMKNIAKFTAVFCLIASTALAQPHPRAGGPRGGNEGGQGNRPMAQERPAGGAEKRQEVRENRQEHRQEVRENNRENRMEKRQERREERRENMREKRSN